MATQPLIETKEQYFQCLSEKPDYLNQTVALSDGRMLGFAQYGDPLGKPVFFFHGGAGSRLEHPTHVCAVGVRIIVIDRPGHGLSDYQPGRQLLDWPRDIEQLADHLRINKFYVLGWSAGGPHALACAYKLPDRVLAGAVAAGMAPANGSRWTKAFPIAGRAFGFAARYLPGLIRLFRRMARRALLGDGEVARQRLLSAFSTEEREFMVASGNIDMFYDDVREGYRRGWQGAARDDMIIFGDWGFDIADINVRIDVWHGDADKNIPPEASQHLHRRIPNSRATFLPGEGHMFLLSRWPDVIQALVAA
ncbi:MAG TPA: alpha/beta hydrolase [Anaerolineae bacterium]|jgi:pimeloyl-ACP methyl ester carboxylesterase|nr:alpha/beta hydrolase [Anaerolineae bacterium]